jgi:hypothetical protein
MHPRKRNKETSLYLHMIWSSMWNPQSVHKKAARLINESSKVAGYKIRHQAIQETHPAALHRRGWTTGLFLLGGVCHPSSSCCLIVRLVTHLPLGDDTTNSGPGSQTDGKDVRINLSGLFCQMGSCIVYYHCTDVSLTSPKLYPMCLGRCHLTK